MRRLANRWLKKSRRQTVRMSCRTWIRFGPLWRCVPVWSWWWMKCIVGRKRTIKKAEPLGNPLWVFAVTASERHWSKSAVEISRDSRSCGLILKKWLKGCPTNHQSLSYKYGSYQLAPIKTKKHHETMIEVVSVTWELYPRSADVSWCFIWRAVPDLSSYSGFIKVRVIIVN